MIFSFVFFFERSMQTPIKIPTGSIQDKEIEYLESNIHFPIQFLEGADAGCLTTIIFLPDVSDVWGWPNPVKIPNVPFLLQNPQWNQRMNSHEPC
jgi:hypothetical protein